MFFRHRDVFRAPNRRDIDGVYGGQTEGGVAEFQTNSGQTGTGQVDTEIWSVAADPPLLDACRDSVAFNPARAAAQIKGRLPLRFEASDAPIMIS